MRASSPQVMWGRAVSVHAATRTRADGKSTRGRDDGKGTQAGALRGLPGSCVRLQLLSNNK